MRTQKIQYTPEISRKKTQVKVFTGPPAGGRK